MAREQDCVFAALAQGGNLYWEDREAEEEIAAKLASAGCAPQISVGRGDYSHVNRNGCAPANAVNHLLFNRPKKFSLNREWEFAYLVQKDRAARSKLEFSKPSVCCASECAALVAEQFVLYQRLWNRRAVDCDERLVASLAQVMNRACEKLFACAGFA